ncbi:hypothetical protein NBRC116600_18080 [Thalassotalea sp. SU-HH00458]
MIRGNDLSDKQTNQIFNVHQAASKTYPKVENHLAILRDRSELKIS